MDELFGNEEDNNQGNIDDLKEKANQIKEGNYVEEPKVEIPDKKEEKSKEDSAKEEKSKEDTGKKEKKDPVIIEDEPDEETTPVQEAVPENPKKPEDSEELIELPLEYNHRMDQGTADQWDHEQPERPVRRD